MGLTATSLTPDERIEAWKRIAKRISDEHVALAWSHYVFRLLREVFSANEALRECGGFLLQAIAEMYVTHALTVFRRDMDGQAGTESLVNLLFDIKDHAALITRERFLAPYRASWDEDIGTMDFGRWSPLRSERGTAEDHIDPAIIQRDITDLGRAVENVRAYAERLKAHRSPTDPRLTLMFGELHDAIRILRGVVNKYNALVTGSSMGFWEPHPQYDVLKPFMDPWLPEDEVVIRKVIDTVTAEGRDHA